MSYAITITAPGDYITRDGRRVRVHRVASGATFPVQGAVYTLFRGKLRPRGYAIWRADGRYLPLSQHGLDIVRHASMTKDITP